MRDVKAMAVFPVFLISIFAVHAVYAQERFVLEPKNMTVIQGSDTILDCVVEGHRGQVQWTWGAFAMGTDRDLPSFPRYSIEGSQNLGEYNLMISNAQLEDDAMYECQMMAGPGFAGLRSRKAKVDVLVPPDEPTINGSPRVEVVVNKATNITCHADNGKPAASVTWYMNGVKVTNMTYYSFEINTDGKLQNATGMLSITAKKTDQDKTVECEVINDALLHEKSVLAKIDVLFPPEVSMSVNPNKKQLKEGDRVKFSCDSVANPIGVTWKWYQDEDELVGATNPTLDLTSVSRQHHKKSISCEATNKVGSSKQSFPLNVEYGPKFMSEAEHVEVDLGEDAMLVCKVDANPKATIYWKKVGEERILSSSANYRILGVTQRDFGIYTCTATAITRNFEEITMDVHLLKKGAPKIISDASQYAKFGETGKIDCDVKAVPKPTKVIWSRDGKPLDVDRMERYEVKPYYSVGGYKSTLWIASVQDGDFGKYNCTIENGYGNDILVISFYQKDVVPIAFILVGVLLGVVLVIAITIAVFVYHRKKSSASEAGSQDSDASITKKKKDGSPDIKVEYSSDIYGNPVDNWKPEFDQKYYRHSAEYDELNYPSKEPRPMNGYGTDALDGYKYGYNQDYRNPYGTFPGAAASRAYAMDSSMQGIPTVVYPEDARYDPTYGTSRPTYGSDYGTYRVPPQSLPPPSRQIYSNNTYSPPPGPPSISSNQGNIYVPAPPSVASSRLSTNV